MSEDHRDESPDVETKVESPPSVEEARPSLDPDRIVGTILGGRYKVEKKLGQGGMGAVYLALHEAIGKRVAIKCLTSEMAAHKQVIERFKREARAATAAGSEHIIDVTDMGELPDGSPFIVMELLEGRELTELIEDEAPLSVGRTARILQQVCSALTAAHAKGIVHRDLKPSNLMLGTYGEVYVLDWGVAQTAETLGAKAAEIANAVTPLGLRDATPQRAPHYLCLALPDTAPADLVKRLAAHQVFVSQRGDRLRVTPHLYNDQADLARLVAALKAEL